MAPAPVGVAVAGCGYWGKNVVRNFYQMGNLVAVADPSPRILEGLRPVYRGVELVLEFDRLLELPGVSAVAIAAPAESHYALAKRAMLAGKDVFVEKPLALKV